MRVSQQHLSDHAVNCYRLLQIVRRGERMMCPRRHARAERNQTRYQNREDSLFHYSFIPPPFIRDSVWNSQR